jgi:hypothetical protein
MSYTLLITIQSFEAILSYWQQVNVQKFREGNFTCVYEVIFPFIHFISLTLNGHLKFGKWLLLTTFVMGNFVMKDQWENQEQDERTSLGGTHHWSYEYEDRGDEHKTEKKGRVFWGRLGPRRGWCAIHEVDRKSTRDGSIIQILQVNVFSSENVKNGI